ncbi:MAG TPA: carbohydrate ABC transporter permease [Aggregatilineaceae bacterium]|nr:carbohydrate ABC transporter permease [Aggregatilineaceae bacterium]
MASTTQTTSSQVVPTADVRSAGSRRRKPIHINPFQVLVYIILTLGALLFALPFLWMVSTSLSNAGDVLRGRFIPTLQFISVTEVTQPDMERKVQDYLDAGASPEYLAEVRTQIEGRRQQRELTMHDYLRREKYGYADIRVNIPLLHIDRRYAVVGGAAHYIEAWDESNFSKYFFNSVKVAAITIFAQTITSVLAAYAFAKIDFPGRNLLFALFLATIFIPPMVVLIPNRNTVTSIDRFFVEDFPGKQDEWGITDARREIGDAVYSMLDKVGLENFLGLGDVFKVDGPLVWRWMDSWPALIVPFLASTFSIFLLRQFFLQIPEDLWDAARIDGAGHLRFLFQVVLPISRAALVTTVIFTFIGTWNALEWPLLVTFSDNWRPISYGLYAFQTEAGQNLNLLMSAAVITLIPVILMYLFAQRQFTEGIATTGLKG